MKFIILFLSFSVLQQFSWCWRMWRPRPSSKDRACWTWRWARGSTATTRRPRSGTGKWPNARPALRLRSEFVSAGCRCVTRTIDKHLTREIVSGCSTLSLCFLNASLKKCWNVRPRERGQDLLLFLLPDAFVQHPQRMLPGCASFGSWPVLKEDGRWGPWRQTDRLSGSQSSGLGPARIAKYINIPDKVLF